MAFSHPLSTAIKNLKETLTIYFKALDYDKAINIPGITIDQESKDKGVSLKKSK